jgi:hypothetical protein
MGLDKAEREQLGLIQKANPAGQQDLASGFLAFLDDAAADE